MNIKQLEAFIYIAEEKNFTKAAKLLYMTQPAISFQVKALEEELGARLFERLDKKVFLTEAGEVLYPHAKDILASYDRVKDGIVELKGLGKGNLTIGASTIPGEYILPQLIGKFKAQFPGIIITLKIGSTAEIQTKLEERKIDIAVIGARPEGAKNISFKLTTDELVLIASTKIDKDELEVKDLISLPFICREVGSGTRKIVEKKLKDLGLDMTTANIQMELGSTRAILTAVEASLGYSFVSNWAIQEAIKLGKVKRIKVKGLEIKRDLYGAINPQKYNSGATKTFKKLIEESLKVS